MTPLEAELHEIISTEGPISIERYMQLCLQHPRYGYYTTREAIGRDGDFVTAPEINQMFGELIGLWAAQVWMDMGAPPLVRLVELGPGRGTLMADVLRSTRVVPGFREAARVELVETSARLEVIQRAKLDGVATRMSWHRTVEELPDGPAIILANEFFDALPVRHYVRGAGGWHERVIGLDEGHMLSFGAAAEPIEPSPPHDWTGTGDAGQILEVNHASLQTMRHLASRVATTGGALLVCDYGHAESGFGETLQAVRGHAFADVLAMPGEADLTAHVDFAALASAARAVGAAVHGPIEQGTFLRRLGILERAVALKARADAHQAAAIDAALARFTSSGSSMTSLFKVIAVTPRDAAAPPGFEGQQ